MLEGTLCYLDEMVSVSVAGCLGYDVLVIKSL